jgi:hypothetical protein
MRKRRRGEDRPPDAGQPPSGAAPKKRRRQKGAGDAPKKPTDAPKKRRRFRLAKDRRVEAVGVALIAFGCLVTGLVWMGVRESNNVSYQLPIIASGGLVAVGCFIVGGLLVVGGLVMTRFARLEKARAAPATTERAPEAPAPPPVVTASDQEVSLPDESVERRELAG